MRRPNEYQYRQDHRLRVMAGTAVALFLLAAGVTWWPAPRPSLAPELVFDTRGDEVINLEDIVPTTQMAQAPPPPAPLPPVVVPDDQLPDEVELDLSDNIPVDKPGDALKSAPPTQGPGRAERTVSAEVGPKTVRFVEPEYTREARRRKIRAEVIVEVLVNEQGRVQQTRIVERFLLGRDAGDRQPVATLGYGLEEAALAAAERWIFRPARQNGQAVASFTTLTFTFGV